MELIKVVLEAHLSSLSCSDGGGGGVEQQRWVVAAGLVLVGLDLRVHGATELGPQQQGQAGLD